MDAIDLWFFCSRMSDLQFDRNGQLHNDIHEIGVSFESIIEIGDTAIGMMMYGGGLTAFESFRGIPRQPESCIACSTHAHQQRE